MARAKKQAQTGTKALTLPGKEAQILMAALRDLSNNRMPVRMSVKIGRWLTATAEYVDKLDENLRELFMDCSGGKDSMENNSIGLKRFEKESKSMYEEVYEIELEGSISLDKLDKLDNVEVSPQSIQKLIEHGLVTD